MAARVTTQHGFFCIQPFNLPPTPILMRKTWSGICQKIKQMILELNVLQMQSGKEVQNLKGHALYED